MTRRKPRRTLTHLGGTIDSAWIENPSLNDIMAEGTADEIREALGALGRNLRSGIELFPDERELVGAALEAIGRGENPKAALGLTTNRRIPLAEKRARAALVRSMMEHDGLSEREALDLAHRLSLKPGGRAYLADVIGVTEKVRKRIQRAKRRDKPPL